MLENNKLDNYNENTFESIKRIDEYWEARELQIVLEYSKWQKFVNVINKVTEACFNSNNNVNNHFTYVGKMVKTGDSIRQI